jgi:16S rRNA (uracil1498-N3)-methyltransferase
VHSLVFALCKGDHNDEVCRKATEFGVHNVIFWQSARSVVRLAGKDRAAKLERWTKIAESACAQSGQPRAPKITLCLSEAELFSALASVKLPGDRLLCCSLSSGAAQLRSLDRPENGVHLLVGPEGDLTPEEEQALAKFGFEPVTLGRSRLRAETAAVAAIAAVECLWERA